ncbi:MAG: preprotein translocase subunit SecE [Gaiellaceae bacterium]
MARQTRSERRARRQAQLASGAAGVPAARAPGLPAADGADGARAPIAAGRPGRSFPGSGSRRFVLESWGELRKVEWPGQNQVIQGTAVVLIACIIIGIFLYASDQVFRRLVENVFLGQ